jgi:predicted dehydrogenase
LIRIGVIGCGYWGPNLVRALSETEGATVARVSDLRPGRLELIARRHPGVETTARAEDILSDAAIDAVVIATPPDTHCALALEALNRGKHILVEKPLATRTADAERIVELAARKQRSLLVGHLFLYHPAVVKIRSLLESGDLGTVYCISSTRCNLGPPNTNIDVLWDLAPHDISVILHLMQDTPIEVKAYGAAFTNPRFAETVFATLRFGDGRVAHIHVSWLTPGKTRVLQLIGSKRVVIYDDMQPVQKVQIFEPGIDNRVNASDKDAAPLGFMPGGIWIPPLKSYEPLRAECEDFVASIQTGRAPLSDGTRALEVVRVLEAASACLRAGGQSVFTPDKPDEDKYQRHTAELAK